MPTGSSDIGSYETSVGVEARWRTESKGLEDTLVDRCLIRVERVCLRLPGLRQKQWNFVGEFCDEGRRSSA
eukprot:759424-Hanusia_phi.AAC.9